MKRTGMWTMGRYWRLGAGIGAGLATTPKDEWSEAMGAALDELWAKPSEPF